MPDIERVIKGLETCTSSGLTQSCKEGCPYFRPGKLPDCVQLKKDALFLLKEQEGVEPIFDSNTNVTPGLWRCGSCGMVMSSAASQVNYCWSCGRRVDWNGYKSKLRGQ